MLLGRILQLGLLSMALFSMTGTPVLGATGFRYDAGSIQKIHYLLASSQGVGRSGFGHAYLRLSAGQNPSFNDDVIEFVAGEDVSTLTSYLRAVGLGAKMKRRVFVEKYSRVVHEMNFVALRDLTSYELKLTQEQKSRLLKLISQSIDDGELGNYQFFSDNCASAAAELFQASGISIARDIRSWIPTQIPGLLKEANLISGVSVDYNLRSRRLMLFESFAPSLTETLPEFVALKENLVAPQLASRVLGLDRLIEAARSRGGPSAALSRYLTAFKFLEPLIVRDELNQVIRGEISLQGKALDSFRLDFPYEQADWNSEAELVHQQVVQDAQGAFSLALRYNLRPVVPLPNSPFLTRNVRVAIPSLKEDRDGNLYYGERRIGVRGNRTLHDGSLFFNGLYFLPEVNRVDSATWEGSVYVISDSDASLAAERMKLVSINNKNFLPFKNNDPNRSSCIAMVELQKALLTRTIFAPELAPLTETQSLELVDRLLDGLLAVVPGFADPTTWLSSLNADRLRDVIYRFNHDRYETVTGAIQAWWDSEKLTAQDLLELGRLARSGHPTPVYQRVRGGIAHAILILDVIDEGEDLRLHVYDPNFGFTKDSFRFDKKAGQVRSPFYPSEPLKAQKVDLDRELIDQTFMGPAMQKLLVELTAFSGIYSTHLGILLNVY